MALPYEIFIGLRYLRAKRRNRTISLNTVVSITGITLGVAALIGTVGIMTGFKEDIQAKILGTTAHILVHDRMKEAVSDCATQVKRVEEVPDVVAATPFVLRQVLLTSQSGVQGVVLRGIDPAREGKVTELEKNLISGTLQDLSKPVKVAIAEKDREPGGPAETLRPGIILGKELAMRLGVYVGDTLNVVSAVGPVTGAPTVTVMETCREPDTPPLSVTDAVMTWVPAVKVRENDAPFPIWPIRLDVQRRLPERLPSWLSLALPENDTVAPSG